MTALHRCLGALVVVAALAFTPVVSAGPPLICHPFVTDAGASLLPWAPGKGWHLPDPAYDAANLVPDTLALLSTDAPILSRMENMRRATIYAERDREVAAALLRAVVERTQAPPADARALALRWFDAGYLVESYRQLGLVYEHGMRPAKGPWVSLVPPELADLDGYALVRDALALAPQSHTELELASSLMSP